MSNQNDDDDVHWLMESAAPLPKNIPSLTYVSLVQAHDCYCVCVGIDQDRYGLALWRKDDVDAIFLQASFSEPPLLQIAKAPQEHSCWFVYAVDNQHADGPQLLAWEITSRSFLPAHASSTDPPQASIRIAPGRKMNVWPPNLLPPKDDPSITSLAVLQPDDIPKPMLLFGTACGIPLWSTQISIPMDFHIQKVEASAKQQSLFSFGLSLIQYQPPNAKIVAMIPMLLSTTNAGSTFVVVDVTGKMSFYEMEHRSDQIRFTADCFVMNLLREYFANAENNLYDMQVEHAVAYDAQVQFVCLVHHSETSSRYWVTVKDDALQSVVLIPDDMTVAAFVMGTNGIPYAVLEQHGNEASILATLVNGEIATQSLVRTTFHGGIVCPDHTTHGVLLVPSNAPSLLRARYMPESSQVQQQNETRGLALASVREMDTLKSLFETWYSADSDAAISVGSLQNPCWQAAVLPLAQTVSQTFRNPMERHLSYIRFLQDIGLYKFLSETTKWSLLAIGQNLQVSQTVAGNATIAPDEMVHFLVGLQRINGPQWLDCLHMALKAAKDHRETYGPPNTNISYDIINIEEAHPGLLWTSSILTSVLEPQLVMWETLPNGIPDVAEPSPYLEVMQWILEAFRDHGEIAAYIDASKSVFSIVRCTFGKRQDKWLFQLCCNHRYYEGVMTIHSQYNHRAPFGLTSIAERMSTDLETNMPFKQYAVKWLAEHEAVGRALPLHTQWPDEFYEVAETTPSLKPYQWMVDVVRGNHNKVAEDILQRVTSASDLTLLDAVVVLGAAFGSNELVIQEDTVNRERAKKRGPTIEKKQDLLQILFRFDPKPKMFLTPAAALNKAMKRICGEAVSNNIDDYSMALEICSTFDSDDDATKAALMVWTKALLADKETFLRWIDKEADLTAPHIQEEVRKSTIFGQLMEYSDDSVVAWTNAWDELQDLDDLFQQIQLRRLIASYCNSRQAHDAQDVLMIEG